MLDTGSIIAAKIFGGGGSIGEEEINALKEYVDESINQSSAFFRGTFATKYDLMNENWQTSYPTRSWYVSNNDYAYVEADESHDGESWRYIYVYNENGINNGWQAQYKTNEAPFTQEQLDAINSGINATGVSRIGTIAKEFGDLVPYEAGDYVLRGGKLYIFKEDHVAGAWVASEVSEVVVGDELSNIKEMLDGVYQCETMTMAEYDALTQAQKMDGTVRFITDVNSYPDAGGVGF